MRVLNLYAGIGGNRKLWPISAEVTAVEWDRRIAEIYSNHFKGDTVLEEDAHEYLLKHYKEFDFIWSSPPCPTHSRTNTFLNAHGVVRYPDMKLYQEIIFLRQWAKCPWVVENVIPYYEPLIKPTILIDRHYFWSNFPIAKAKANRNWNICNARKSTQRPSKDHIKELQQWHGFTDVTDKILLRNCVNPKLGLHIFNEAFKQTQTTLV